MKNGWLGVLMCGVFAVADAQTYPVRPIRLVASSAVGSGSDVVARLLVPRLTDVLGQTVIVDNRPGASGLIGAELVARATPDAYTIWIVTQTQLISTTLFNRFHLAKGYVPIGMIGGTPFVIMASHSLKVKTMADFVALAKAKPGHYLYGSSGTGTSAHMCMELLQSLAGIKLTHVPYKGSMLAMTDVISGQVHISCPAVPTLSLVGNKAQALGVTTRNPTALAPGIAPVAQAVAGYELLGWYGMLAPPGTPAALATQLNRAFTQVLNEKDLREKLFRVGVEAGPTSPEAFSAFLQRETARWSKLLKEAGIKPPS